LSIVKRSEKSHILFYPNRSSEIRISNLSVERDLLRVADRQRLKSGGLPFYLAKRRTDEVRPTSAGAAVVSFNLDAFHISKFL
jgi:hypothetical protein